MLDLVLLIVFGAGASYDAVDITAVRNVQAYSDHWPPLARSLFEDRPNFNAAFAAYPQFGARLLYFRRAARQPDFDVEKELAAVRTEAETYSPARVELAAIQFYIHRIISECSRIWLATSYGATNYVELLGRVERWRRPRNERVMLATFNYDLLLEDAVHRPPIELPTSSMAHYIASETYKLIKPHGSVDWGQMTHQLVKKAQPVAEVERLMIEKVNEIQTVPDEYVITGGSVLVDNAGAAPDQTGVAVPAISIPVMEKSAFACPEAHLGALDAATREVTHVLVIGWRAAEQNFLDRFVRRLGANPSFLIVARNLTEAQATKTILLDRSGIDGSKISCSAAAGFTGFLASRELEGFLTS